MRLLKTGVRAALIGALMALGLGGASAASSAPVASKLVGTPPAMSGLAKQLYYSNGTTHLHAMPTVPLAKQMAAVRPPTGGSNDLSYNGGPVMTTTTVYAIFWQPPTMQDGSPIIKFTSTYTGRQIQLLNNYFNHGIGNNLTQYYQVTNGATAYIANKGAFGGYYFDGHPFPTPPGCSDPYETITKHNCLTDAQLQAEITRVANLNKWPAGLGHMIFIYTPDGMGSCTDYTGSHCAYTTYCAYHGAFVNANNAYEVYANEPYSFLPDGSTQCTQTESAPSGDPAADATASTTSREFSDAITDPLADQNNLAWYSSNGGEIGDLCTYNYGTNNWDNGNANEMWNGIFFEIQQEYSNLASACVQVGP